MLSKMLQKRSLVKQLVKLRANSSLQNWLDWLLLKHPQEIDLGLKRVATVAKELNLLKPKPFVITVSGTNGKGSSVAMLASIYQAAGLNVGCYTSPHIFKYNERIKINNNFVTDTTITNAFAKIEQARKNLANIKLTYFEFATLAALFIFAQQKLDLIILEVGLGGRLDAVNIIDANATLITAIGIDHIEWLGSDREKAAIEKAGIMRENQLCVCSDIDIPKSVKNNALKNKVNLIVAKEDFDFNIKLNNWSFVSLNKSFYSIEKLLLPSLKGDFQVQNAAGVIALVLSIKTLPINQKNIDHGLQNIKHFGRLQTVNVNNKSWLIDVAHNVQSAEVLATYLGQINFKGTAVFSVLKDKDYISMINIIKPFISNWYIADLQVARSSSAIELEQTLQNSNIAKDNIKVFNSIADATKHALKEANQSHYLVWGSFFTVAQNLRVLQ